MPAKIPTELEVSFELASSENEAIAVVSVTAQGAEVPTGTVQLTTKDPSGRTEALGGFNLIKGRARNFVTVGHTLVVKYLPTGNFEQKSKEVRVDQPTELGALLQRLMRRFEHERTVSPVPTGIGPGSSAIDRPAEPESRPSLTSPPVHQYERSAAVASGGGGAATAPAREAQLGDALSSPEPAEQARVEKPIVEPVAEERRVPARETITNTRAEERGVTKARPIVVPDKPFPQPEEAEESEHGFNFEVGRPLIKRATVSLYEAESMKPIHHRVKPGQDGFVKLSVTNPGRYLYVLEIDGHITRQDVVETASWKAVSLVPTGVTAESLEDITAYPILTEEISPQAVSMGTAGAPAGAGVPGAADVGQISSKALVDVLGWKLDTDPKAFVNALTQSFQLSEVEGHVESKWVPRTYAVQTDLSGGITGAQASIYSRAKEFLDKSLPLLDGLYSLDEEADPGDIIASKEVVRSQLNELVGELGVLGGPRVSRVENYFHLLLGPSYTSHARGAFDPDAVGGTLGTLRDLLRLRSNSQYMNTVEDEQDVTNYRLLSDYVTSLAQSWISSERFFSRTPVSTTTDLLMEVIAGVAHPASMVGIFPGQKLHILPSSDPKSDAANDTAETVTVISASRNSFVARFAHHHHKGGDIEVPTAPFFGTQLVILSRQLSGIVELLNDVEFSFDSVFIPRGERQNLLLEFLDKNDKAQAPAMFLQELLDWVRNFASSEGPDLIQKAGRYGVTPFVDFASRLQHLIQLTLNAHNSAGNPLPKGFKTERVRRSLQALSSQLQELVSQSKPLRREIPIED